MHVRPNEDYCLHRLCALKITLQVNWLSEEGSKSMLSTAKDREHIEYLHNIYIEDRNILQANATIVGRAC